MNDLIVRQYYYKKENKDSLLLILIVPIFLTINYRKNNYHFKIIEENNFYIL